MLLARGPALSFPAVVATNMPGLHLCLMLAILQLSWLFGLWSDSQKRNIARNFCSKERGVISKMQSKKCAVAFNVALGPEGAMCCCSLFLNFKGHHKRCERKFYKPKDVFLTYRLPNLPPPDRNVPYNPGWTIYLRTNKQIIKTLRNRQTGPVQLSF